MAHRSDPDPRGNTGNLRGEGRPSTNQNQLRSSGVGTPKQGRHAATDRATSARRDRQGRGNDQPGGSTQGGGNVS